MLEKQNVKKFIIAGFEPMNAGIFLINAEKMLL
jgi:hypothetical protein